MATLIKRAILAAIRKRGWELRKLDQTRRGRPPLYDDPWEVLSYMREGQPAAFNCPLDLCVRPFGHSFRRWEHLTEAAREFIRAGCGSYAESVLKRYFDTFKPTNASEAIIGFEMSSLRQFRPHAALCTPWTEKNIKTLITAAERSLAKENAEHGAPGLTVENGTKYFGPVSQRKGELEYKRVTSLVQAIDATGYDRGHGDVDVTFLRRGNELRYLKIGTGYHRTAVMSALGYETIPAVSRYPYVIEMEHANYWPQVRYGVWSRDDAVRYFNHLFDFDSRSWAREHNLLTPGHKRTDVSTRAKET